MSKSNSLKIAIGAAVVTGLGAAGVANAEPAEANLFGMQELSSGYLTAGAHEGGCGEGKCGGEKEEKKEGGCGSEGGCGGDKDDHGDEEA